MRCRSYFYSLLFVLLGLCFGSFIINQNLKASATTQSFTISTPDTVYDLCAGVTKCGDYKYVYADFTSVPFSWNNYFQLAPSYGTPYYSTIYTTGINYFFIELEEPRDLLNVYFKSYLSGSVTVTISSDSPFGSGGGITPSGSLSITENGTYDVTNYAEAFVNVPSTETVVYGDYHDDLVNIYNAILICAGVVLVIYFFYCIYRMFIPTFGGKK